MVVCFANDGRAAGCAGQRRTEQERENINIRNGIVFGCSIDDTVSRLLHNSRHLAAALATKSKNSS